MNCEGCLGPRSYYIAQGEAREVRVGGALPCKIGVLTWRVIDGTAKGYTVLGGSVRVH